MSDNLPFATLNDRTLTVRFLNSPAATSVKVACIVDQTDLGDVIGVEILNLRRQVSGGVVDAPRASGRFRWSYDGEIDAFYFHAMDGRGQVQTPVTGNVSLDTAHRVVLLEVPVPPPTR